MNEEANVTIQTYQPPHLVDSNRLAKLQPLFPQIDRIYKKHAEENGYPGYAYGIVLDGQLIYSGSGGFIDVEKKIAATPQSMFRIASMTKSFTAMAIVKLRDEGKLKLDDPIALYIPEMEAQQLTADSPPITIRDLLIHSAGFPTDDPWGDRKLGETEEQLTSLLKKKISFSNPSGLVYEYSNLGYTLLGHLIKKITGTSYQDYIEANIILPLGIQSYWEYDDVPQTILAHGYRLKGDKWEEEPMLHDGTFGAMGGLITSIESFSRYIAIHQAAWPPRDDIESGPVRRSSVREMHQPWKFIELDKGFTYSSGETASLIHAYGYGLAWSKDLSGRIYVGHSGGLPGFGSNWCFLPEYGLGVVFFANSTYADTAALNINILNKLIVDSILQPRQLPPSDVLKINQNKLLSVLPDWENIPDGIFAENFFLDQSVESRREVSQDLFLKAGKIISVGEMIPDNQLQGHFILRGENADLRIEFGLTPENPPLIQSYQIECKQNSW